MSRTGAQCLVDALAAHNVKHLFTLSGNQILSVYDATVGRDIALVHTGTKPPPFTWPMRGGV